MTSRAAAVAMYAKVMGHVKKWCLRSGIPPQTLSAFCPPHLRCFHNLYANPELWPKLCFLQHDEKDIFRVRGADGLPDFGDGEAQHIAAEYAKAIDDIEHALQPLRSLLPQAQLSAAAYSAAADALRAASPLLKQYVEKAMVRVPLREKHVAKLRKKAAAKPALAARLSKHILFLTEQIAEAATCQRRASTWAGAVAALPAAPAQEHTSSALLDLLKEHHAIRALVEVEVVECRVT